MPGSARYRKSPFHGSTLFVVLPALHPTLLHDFLLNDFACRSGISVFLNRERALGEEELKSFGSNVLNFMP